MTHLAMFPFLQFSNRFYSNRCHIVSVNSLMVYLLFFLPQFRKTYTSSELTLETWDFLLLLLIFFLLEIIFVRTTYWHSTRIGSFYVDVCCPLIFHDRTENRTPLFTHITADYNFRLACSVDWTSLTLLIIFNWWT